LLALGLCVCVWLALVVGLGVPDVVGDRETLVLCVCEPVPVPDRVGACEGVPESDGLGDTVGDCVSEAVSVEDAVVDAL